MINSINPGGIIDIGGWVIITEIVLYTNCHKSKLCYDNETEQVKY